ncbi:chemotaxis protein CheW [Pleionea litopenaei]|uniref:Chemotaxis protein CheW n=1 Tax=Pleionea litopenaei TaxID=3070815 RepID=A0AA51RQN6_9GAMM|nr:chemotaxis protein CheW [Pleionea sp. HL-JVS1]WMS85878.1 chemotaxis protein CheW [Pleionea sp. HL-JVS1]
MENKIAEVYSLMIPIIDQSILLPNVTVAEIVPFGDVAYQKEGADWFIGTLHWHGIKVPMISLDILNGGEDPQANKRSRVAVVHTINGDEEMPYIAIIVQGIPRLTHVTEPSISMVESDSLGVADKAKVQIGTIQATIPDLDKLEALIKEELAA